MKEPILTIGIPTYNRPNSIVKTVRALLPQLNDLVVLRVWDNCSDIPVVDLFTEEEKKKFTIARNKANIGGDANIAGCIYHASTKWVWTLGDDDIPNNEAVKTILFVSLPIKDAPRWAMTCLLLLVRWFPMKPR